MSTHPKHRAPARAPLTRGRQIGLAALATFLTVSGTVFALDLPTESPDPAPAAEEVTEPEVPVIIDGKTVKDARTLNVDRAVAEVEARKAEPLPNLTKMSLPQLQTYAVKMQREFVHASMAYDEAKTQSEQATAAAEAAEKKSRAAKKKAKVARDEFALNVSQTYQSGLMANPTVKMLATETKDGQDFVESFTAVRQATDAQAINVDTLNEVSAEAKALSDEATTLRAQAKAAEGKAEVLLDDIQGRAAKVAAAANQALANATDDRTLFASAEQQARNDAALKQWRTYLRALDAAKVVPPPAQALANPADGLPRGLTALRGPNGVPIRGVAAKPHRGKALTVLPRETITAISRSFAAVGKPFVDGNTGPQTYDCTGLVTAAWAKSGYPVTAATAAGQARSVRWVNPGNAQVGDLVFFTAPKAGVQHVGLNLGGQLMLSADATAQQVGVQQFPAEPFAVARVTLPAPADQNEVPASAEDSPLRCGGTPPTSAGSGFIFPIREGKFRYSAAFGAEGAMWADDHTGQDFSAPTGTPVMAASSGRARITPTGWGGPHMITITHGGGLQTVYAHLSRAIVTDGARVAAGEVIGAVGSEGNSTGPHLHFEVLIGGVKVDPMLFLAGDGAASATGWGGFANGMIPAASLCPLAGTSGHRLRCDAAAAWNAMAQAYRKDMGQPLCITDSYRSYAAQVRTYAAKPTLAAVPGTSNHGWALAVDLCGGINNFGTAEHRWMVTNAAAFGWRHPQWARQGGSREEPWHWEFGNIS